MSDITAATHFHPLTKTRFELGRCAFCNGTAALSPVACDAMPSGSKIWGEEKLPAREIVADDLETPCCSVCKGYSYYIENVKSEWAVIERKTGAVAALRKSEKAAKLLCETLNNPTVEHSAPVAVNEAVEGNLTTGDSDVRLPGMVVIRLAGDLPNGLKRGMHIQLPIDQLTALISEIGATPMAKATERKTAKELIRALILKKKTDDEIILAARDAFPESQADKKHCTKYRRELLVEKAIGPELAAVGSPDHREWAAANPALAKKGPHAEYHKAAEAKAKEAAANAKAKPAAKPAAAPVVKAAPKPAAKPVAKPTAAASKATAKPAKPATKPAAKPAAPAKKVKAKAPAADALEI